MPVDFSMSVGPGVASSPSPRTGSSPTGSAATSAVSKGGRDLGVLQPRMNQYSTEREPIGTPAVRTSLREDLYLSVMNIDPDRGTLGLLAMVNPMVGCLWAATAVMALGGLMALVPGRRRIERTAPAPAVAPGLAARPAP